MTHDRKSCSERPRKLGAKFTNKHIAPDEIILHEEEKDVTGGCFDSVVKRFAACDAARRKYLIGEDGDDDFRVDEGKAVDFAKVEKRVLTTGDGGSTGSVRNLRIREDTAKYLWIWVLILLTMIRKLGPCGRILFLRQTLMRNSMVEITSAGTVVKLWSSRTWSSSASVRSRHRIIMFTSSFAGYKNYMNVNMKEKVKTRTKDSIFEKYGNAASDQEEMMPREVLLGQSERQIEYDRAGRIVRGQDQAVVPKSKYELHVCNISKNHSSVWGSWWKDHQWGYKSCRQVFRNSYCTGPAGIEAADQDARIGN